MRLSSSLSARLQFACVVPDLHTIVVDLRSSRRRPTKPFVHPLSASVRFVRPQLSPGETPLSGLELRQAQHLGTQPSSPTIGTDRDHRHVREPGQRVRAGPVMIEGLKHECHRHQLAVFFHQLCEARRISKAALDLSLGLSDTTAGHRPQRQPKLCLPCTVRCHPQPSYGRDVRLARNTSCRHQLTLLRRQLDGRGSPWTIVARPAVPRRTSFEVQNRNLFQQLLCDRLSHHFGKIRLVHLTILPQSTPATTFAHVGEGRISARPAACADVRTLGGD